MPRENQGDAALVVRFVALLLTVLTGFSGLVYEVAWQKAFAILLGSHSEATAAVLGIFLGGLSLGYAIFGEVSRRALARARETGRPARILRLYGFIEAGIGVWALLFPSLFDAARALSAHWPAVPDGVAFGFDVVLTALLIGPPTVLMGGTIPLLTQALSRGLEDATRFHAFVYGFNTAGAFAGALAGGFLLIPWLGIPATLAAMGVVNLAVGSAFVAIGWRRGLQAGPAPAPDGPPLRFASYAAAAALLGFAMMSIQTVLIRLGGLAFGASHFTFAMVVAVFVLCIAVGSLAVSAFPRIPRLAVVGCPLLLALLLALLYPQLQYAPYYAHLLRILFRSDPAAFYPYYLSAFVAIGFVLAIPIGLSGASLPLLFHALRREVGELGRVAGRLYSWNTVGNLLGALLGGYALLFFLDLHHVYRLGVAAIVVAAALLAVGLYRVPRLPVGAALAGLLVLLALAPPWEPAHLSSGLFRQREPLPGSWNGPWAAIAGQGPDRFLFYEDGPTATTSVLEHWLGDGRKTLAILSNGKSDGSLIGDYPTMALVGLLPCLLADECRSAFVIGYGTGTTAGELAALDEMQRVDVAEIAHGVIEAAPLFEYGNQQAFSNPKVRVMRSDAYRALLRTDARYDVISSEPSNPWVSGVEMLYSREFLTAARDRLRPGGVYAQWIHAYAMDDATLDLVLRTYAAVFDSVSVWFTSGPDLVLIGLVDGSGALDVERLERRMAQPDYRAGLARADIETMPQMLAHELLPLGAVNAAGLDGVVHTLMHPLLSQRAARAFFVGGQARLPVVASPEAARVGRENSLWRLWAARHGGPTPEERRAFLEETCHTRFEECATLVARWQAEDPDSPELARVLERMRSHGGLAALVEPDRLAMLASFYGSGPGAMQSPDEASRATELYARSFLPAEPFDRDAINAVWRHCRGPRCGSQLEAAERLVGDIVLVRRSSTD